jgi:DNA-binding NtrC family response regulator
MEELAIIGNPLIVPDGTSTKQIKTMASLANTNIYLAIRNTEDRSQIEDHLVLDGADVSSFASARELWSRFQTRPVRFVITDRRFGADFDGMELVRRIRKKLSASLRLCAAAEQSVPAQGNQGGTGPWRG